MKPRKDVLIIFCDIFLSSCTFGCWANLVPMPSCPAVLGTNSYRKSHYWIISTRKCFLGSLFNCLSKRPQFHSVNLARKRSFGLHLSLCTLCPLLFKTYLRCQNNFQGWSTRWVLLGTQLGLASKTAWMTSTSFFLMLILWRCVLKTFFLFLQWWRSIT